VRKIGYIIMSGMDGSGKTTKARSLQKYLVKKNVKAIYVWYRWRAYLSYVPLFIAKIAGLTTYKYIDNMRIAIRRYYMNKPLAYLWAIAQIIDYTISYLLVLLYIRSYGVRIIIFDRFLIPDKLIDLLYETRLNVFKLFFIRALIYWFLRELRENRFILIYNKIDPFIVLARRKDIPSKCYPYIYASFYNKIMKIFITEENFLQLNGLEPFEDNLKTLISFARGRLRICGHEQ
jgi:hypothetical protein